MPRDIWLVDDLVRCGQAVSYLTNSIMKIDLD